jgi:hypothetical protein
MEAAPFWTQHAVQEYSWIVPFTRSNGVSRESLPAGFSIKSSTLKRWENTSYRQALRGLQNRLIGFGAES